jgi:hypothetical protein
MQVFVPVATSLAASAETLDQSRAGNQCWRESLTLFRGKWPHHPAHQLFAGHTGAFALYNLNLIEHVYNNGWCREEIYQKWYNFWAEIAAANDDSLPLWWGDERIHSTHRAALLYKDPDWYGQYGWTEEPRGPGADGKLQYVWPEDLSGPGKDYHMVCSGEIIARLTT